MRMYNIGLINGKLPQNLKDQKNRCDVTFKGSENYGMGVEDLKQCEYDTYEGPSCEQQIGDSEKAAAKPLAGQNINILDSIHNNAGKVGVVMKDVGNVAEIASKTAETMGFFTIAAKLFKLIGNKVSERSKMKAAERSDKKQIEFLQKKIKDLEKQQNQKVENETKVNESKEPNLNKQIEILQKKIDNLEKQQKPNVKKPEGAPKAVESPQQKSVAKSKKPPQKEGTSELVDPLSK